MIQRLNILNLVILSILSFSAPYLKASEMFLLNCSLEGGYPDNQIYVNEVDGYVLYNAQNQASYERIRRFIQNIDGQNTIRIIDQGKSISTNNEQYILANDQTSSFVLIKDTLEFAYAWTTIIPGASGMLIAFSNSHSGRCTLNPFKQP